MALENEIEAIDILKLSNHLLPTSYRQKSSENKIRQTIRKEDHSEEALNWDGSADNPERLQWRK